MSSNGARLVCDIPMCGRELKAGTGSKGGMYICERCASARYYWKAKGQDALIARAERLTFWQQRIDYITPLVASNVRKARAALDDLREQAQRLTSERLAIARIARRRTKTITNED